MLITSCAAIIEGFFKRNGGWPRLRGELAAYYWPRIVGPEIASKTEAGVFRNGYLIIKTENPALAHQLTLMQRDIVFRYRQQLGEKVLMGLRVKIGTIFTAPSPKYIDVLPELTDEEEKLIESSGEGLVDQELAERLRRLMRRALKNKRFKKAVGGGNCIACGTVIDPGFQYCPCCERKINEEMNAYLDFINKNKRMESMVQKDDQAAAYLFQR